MKRLLALVVVLGILAPTTLLAGEHSHELAQVTIWVPDTWTVEKKGDLLSARSPGQTVGMTYYVLEANDPEKSLEEMDKTLKSRFEDVRNEGEPKVARLNGMHAVVSKATGTVKGRRVEIAIGLVDTPAKRVLLVLGVVESGRLGPHRKDIDEMLSRVEPRKPKKGW